MTKSTEAPHVKTEEKVLYSCEQPGCPVVSFITHSPMTNCPVCNHLGSVLRPPTVNRRGEHMTPEDAEERSE